MSYESGRLFCLEGKTQWYIHGEEDKDQNMKSLNVKNIFTNWPTNIKAGGPIKADKAQLSYKGNKFIVRYEIPVEEPWTMINPLGSRGTNDRNECVINYTRDTGNLPAATFPFIDLQLCKFYEDYLL